MFTEKMLKIIGFSFLALVLAANAQELNQKDLNDQGEHEDRVKLERRIDEGARSMIEEGIISVEDWKELGGRIKESVGSIEDWVELERDIKEGAIPIKDWVKIERRIEEGVRSAKENRRIDFYGKVVDDDGNPLRGVRVELNVRSNVSSRFVALPPVVGKQIFRTTDRNGLFSVRNERGIRLIVGDMNLAGYRQREYSRGYSYSYPDLAPEDKRPPTNKDKPAVFVMRKMGQLMPLLKGDGGSTVLTPDGAFHDVPLFSRLQLRTVFGKNYLDYRMPALQAKWEIPEDGKGWLVTIKGKHEGDGVIVSDQRFFEAPEEGYLPEVTIPVPPEGRYPRVFICLRTATPITYSLVEVSIRASIRPPPDDLRIHVQSFTNPYGNRSLEDDPSARFPSRRIDAYKAIANGENPRLPTEKELLEFKAKREKEKAESDARLEEQMKKIREDEKKKKR